MNLKVLKFVSLLLLIVSSCTIKPKKIEYGSDACSYCKMTIVDKQHAAEMVTKKGKVFKYDAIECLLNHIEDKDISKMELLLVTDYLTPEKLINAKSATFLISKHIQSPMGANLSAFEKINKVNSFVKDDEDKLYSWDELKKYFYNE